MHLKAPEDQNSRFWIAINKMETLGKNAVLSNSLQQEAMRNIATSKTTSRFGRNYHCSAIRF